MITKSCLNPFRKHTLIIGVGGDKSAESATILTMMEGSVVSVDFLEKLFLPFSNLDIFKMSRIENSVLYFSQKSTAPGSLNSGILDSYKMYYARENYGETKNQKKSFGEKQYYVVSHLKRVHRDSLGEKRYQTSVPAKTFPPNTYWNLRQWK